MDKKLTKINVFPGRFQPFHSGHLQACKDAFEENGLKTVIMYIHNEKFDARKPFSDDLIKKELEIIKKNEECIEDVIWLSRPMPTLVCRVLVENGYDPVLWLAGEDRIDNYKKLIQYDRIQSEFGIKGPEFYETKRYGSATAVRAAIKEDNEEEFKKLMPKGTDKLYQEFKTALSSIKESRLFNYILNKSIKPITSFIHESLVTEGGHSVEGAEPIRGDLAKVVADEIISKFEKKFKCKCAALGSVGKKTKEQTSGDIDIAVELEWDKLAEVKKFATNELNAIEGNVNNQLHVFNVGYEYDEDGKHKIVQVDFMFTDNVEFAQFAYNSPDFTKNESKYKGMYQSTLLMSIVSNTPVEDVLGDEYKEELFTKDDYDGSYDGEVKSYWKLYFDQNDGLKVEHKSFEGKTKPTKNPTTIKEDKKIITKDIDKILKMCLGDKATKDTCTTFEKELAFICSDDYKYKSKEQLEKIKNDFLNDWQLKMKTSKETMDEFKELFDNEINNI